MQEFELYVASLGDESIIESVQRSVGARLCRTTAAGSPLPDEAGLAILRPSLAHASAAGGCVVGAGRFDHVTVVAWGAPHAPAIKYRSQHLFIFEHAMPARGCCGDLGRCIEIVNHAEGFEFACAADYRRAHGGAYVPSDAPDGELVTSVLFNQQRDVLNLQRLGQRWAFTAQGVEDVQAEDRHLLASFSRAPPSLSDAQLSLAVADAFEAADAFGDVVTHDNLSGGASIQLGWRERVQGDDEAVDGFYPLRVRKRDHRRAPIVERLVAGIAPTLHKAAKALAAAAPWTYDRIHAMSGLGDPTTKGSMAYPPRHLQTQEPDGAFLPFLSHVVRLKGPAALTADAFDHAVLDGPVGIHSDEEDSCLGVIVTQAVARREGGGSSDAVLQRRTAKSLHNDAWQRLRTLLRLRGGAFGGSAFTSAERAARRRENQRRAAAGLPRLPRGLWDAQFGPGLPAYFAALGGGGGAAGGGDGDGGGGAAADGGADAGPTAARDARAARASTAAARGAQDAQREARAVQRRQEPGALAVAGGGDGASSSAGLTAYELQREANIAANDAYLASIGLGSRSRQIDVSQAEVRRAVEIIAEEGGDPERAIERVSELLGDTESGRRAVCVAFRVMQEEEEEEAGRASGAPPPPPADDARSSLGSVASAAPSDAPADRPLEGESWEQRMAHNARGKRPQPSD